MYFGFRHLPLGIREPVHTVLATLLLVVPALPVSVLAQQSPSDRQQPQTNAGGHETVPSPLPPRRVASTEADRQKAAEFEKRGVICYEELNYGCAQRALEGALALHETERAHQYLAFTLVALGKEQEAADHFYRIFELTPDYRLSRKAVSPKIYRVYRLALRRYEAQVAARDATILGEGRQKVEEFFSGLVNPIQEEGVSWYAIDLSDRLYTELDVGFALLAGDDFNGLSDAFEMGLTFGGRVLYGLNEHLVVGPDVRYSMHLQRNQVGPVSLDILNVGAQVRMQEITEVFLFYLSFGGGATFSGLDSIGDRDGWYVAPHLGVHAIVTNRLSLGASGGLTIMRQAGVPGNDTTYQWPVQFELSYIY